MTQNLAFELQANKSYVGVNNATGEAISFNTGTACGNNNQECIMNGNTLYDSNSEQWYYSWHAATAGSGTGISGGIDAANSICPERWRLPPNYTIDTIKSYGSLTNAYNLTVDGANNSTNYISQFEKYPLDFYRWGDRQSSGRNYYNTIGFWWESTAYSVNRGHSLYYDSTHTWPRDSNYGWRGFPVRCVAL